MSPSDDVTASISQDGLLLIDRDNGKLFTSNDVGAAIWRCLEQGMPVPEIATTLATQYGVPSDVTLTDVERFINQLQSRGLVN